MHELSLMEAVREQALAEAARHGGGAISAISLRIGALCGVEPQALQLACAVVMAGTAAEAARLTIESVPATWFCEPCQQRFIGDQGLCDCPHCGAFSHQLLAGRELQLVALELGP